MQKNKCTQWEDGEEILYEMGGGIKKSGGRENCTLFVLTICCCSSTYCIWFVVGILNLI